MEMSNAQSSDFDRLVTVATLLAQGGQDSSSATGGLVKAEPNETVPASAAVTNIDIPQLIAASNRSLSQAADNGMPPLTRGPNANANGSIPALLVPSLAPSAATAPNSAQQLSVQEPSALKALQTLLSQLQERQTMEQQQQQQQQQAAAAPAPAAIAQLQALPSLQQMAGGHFPYPILHMAPPGVAAAANATSTAQPQFVASLPPNGASSLQYQCHPNFAHNMTLLQPFGQPGLHTAAFVPAPQLGGEALSSQLQASQLIGAVQTSSHQQQLSAASSQALATSGNLTPAASALLTPAEPTSAAETAIEAPPLQLAAPLTEPTAQPPSAPKKGTADKKPASGSKSAKATLASGALGSVQSGTISKRRKTKTKRNPSHNVIEARYRDSINAKLKKLKTLVAGKDAKIQKSLVLQRTLERLNKVDEENATLRKENNNLKSSHIMIAEQIQKLHAKMVEQGIPVDPSLVNCPMPELSFVADQQSSSGTDRMKYEDEMQDDEEGEDYDGEDSDEDEDEDEVDEGEV